MVYLNYLSKVRNKIGTTQEEIQKEVEYNKGKIATKIFPNTSRIKVKHEINAANNKLYQIIRYYLHTDPTPQYSYKTFQIPKRSGGMREICAPEDKLKELQSQILKIITKDMKFLPHNAAHGFTRKRNCKTSLEVHRAHGSRWFLKLDIKDFFPNTTEEVLRKSMSKVYPFCCMHADLKEALIKVCTKDGATPQGAPTSPLLTNMVMVPKDVKITKYCKEHGLVYTRYADDILISSRVSFDWQQVQKDISEMLGYYVIKEEKTRYGSFNGRNWNLGLMYNNKFEITVGHKKKQLVKNMIHNYMTKEEQHTYETWYKLLGIVGYCAYIEPQYFTPYLDVIKAAQPA